DPTVINGGIINAYGTNARLGAGDWMVVEADESDGTFLKLPADVAIVTNVDPEHLDHFKTFEAVQEAFRAFVEHVPFYGFAVIRTALGKFGGVRRRFTRTGEWNGVPIIDDYGHHPVEIAAVLRAARESSKGQVIAVVQPHRYTRLASLFEQFSTCFNDADTVIVAHVYPAGEAPIAGADRDSLVQGLRAHGHRQVIPLDGAQDLARMVKRLAQPGDIVVCLGAGNITQWAYAVPGQPPA